MALPLAAELIVLFFIVAIGSTLQRVSGMGLGLVAGPILAMLMGPVHGILVLNVLACVNAIGMSVSVRRNVEWHKFWWIAPFLVVGALPGALLIRAISPGLLQVIVGVLLLIGLGATTFGKHYIPVVHGRVPMVVSGAIGGFMNTLAGIAGPAITVYAQAARWPQQGFAATLQPIFVVSGLVSFLIKIGTGAGSLEGTPWAIWPVGLVGMAVGIWTGVQLSRRIPRDKARTLALILASAGGVMAIVQGLVKLA